MMFDIIYFYILSLGCDTSPMGGSRAHPIPRHPYPQRGACLQGGITLQ